MSSKVIVHKGRTNVITVDLGIDVTADTITSEIRSEPNQESPLLATWEVTKTSGGSDGHLTLKMDDVITAQIKAASGYMDIKRLSAGEPIPVFDQPIEVEFRGTVTA